VARPALAKLVDTLRTSARPAVDADRDLLARFAADRDEAAFRGLVTRHGPTVLAACRQVLSDPADIDDVFQATFLVLMKKAKAVADADRLGGWLFAVAHRTAVRCRSDARRRRARETTAASRTRKAAELPDLSWHEAAAVLHDELNALTDAYRLPLLLCCVQGLTRDEAAEQLGTTVGAIRGRLERGRARLERRLTNRGVVLSAGLLAGLVGTSRAAGPSAGLIELTLRATSGPPSPAAVALARGGVPMTTLWKHTVLAAFLVLGLIGVGLSGDPQPARTNEKAPAKVAATERVITGQVLAADGRPVAAELSLDRPDRERLPLGRTNADGTFRVTIPRDSPGASLVANASGHGLDFLPIDRANDITLKLPKERRLRGRVLDLQGKPVAGATVSAASVGGFNPDTLIEFRMTGTNEAVSPFPATPRGDRTLTSEAKEFAATTDRAGRFEFRGLGVDHLLTLRIRAEGIADAELLCLNRDGFDPTDANKAAQRAEAMGFERAVPDAPWRVCAPDPVIVVEPEKVIRGAVTDPAGKPRAGVRVTFSRPGLDGVLPKSWWAVTDTAGRYEVHGARRHAGYMVECPGDPAAAILPCQGFAKDTPGYEPVVIDLKCAKGLVVTGTVRDKLTGQPVAAELDVEVLVNNPFVPKYPPYMHGTGWGGYRFPTDKDGRFRLVTIPGPVLLMARPRTDDPFMPAGPDPKHPGYFSTDGDHHMFAKYSDRAATRGFVRGAWCRVLDLKPTDDGTTVAVELDPAESRRARSNDRQPHRR
jgi:RNA polymerase sigma factor (sigma-70 family)